MTFRHRDFGEWDEGFGKREQEFGERDEFAGEEGAGFGYLNKGV